METMLPKKKMNKDPTVHVLDQNSDVVLIMKPKKKTVMVLIALTVTLLLVVVLMKSMVKRPKMILVVGLLSMDVVKMV